MDSGDPERLFHVVKRSWSFDYNTQHLNILLYGPNISSEVYKYTNAYTLNKCRPQWNYPLPGFSDDVKDNWRNAVDYLILISEAPEGAEVIEIK